MLCPEFVYNLHPGETLHVQELHHGDICGDIHTVADVLCQSLDKLHPLEATHKTEEQTLKDNQ